MVAILFAFSTSALAQNGINSPYSQYGIGFNNQPYNMPYISSLGGVSYTLAANNMVNPFNPASYAIIGKETFIFDMGLSIETNTLRSRSNSLYDADGGLGYISFGMPVTKWWKTAFGVMPLTDINYRTVNTVQGDLYNEMSTIYEGVGSISQFYWGHGFNVFGGLDESKPQLRLGFNASFIYGNLTRAITYDFATNDSTYFMDSRRQKDTYVSNFLFDMGLQYDQPIGKDYHLDVGLTFKLPHAMSVKDNSLVYTFVTSGMREYMRDTIFPASGNDSEYESTLEQPLSTGIGISFRRDNKWLVAMDGTFAPWSGLKYVENENVNIFGSSPVLYENNTRLALGMQLLGDKNATKYANRVTYSVGFHYERAKMTLMSATNEKHVLDEWGIGAGVALPVRKGRSLFNVSVAYSSFGTTDLLRRNAFTIGLSFSSCESWFVKRKFN